jgi:type II secretory pathway component PulC
MSRLTKPVIFIFILTAAINIKLIAQAEETTIEGVIVRPVMEYKSVKMRDPFKTYLIKEEPVEVPQDNAEPVKIEFDTEKLKVQGIIWGSKVPQAIINDRVVTIGSLIEGAEVLSIDKKGITLNFHGSIFNLSSPGAAPLKAKKEEVK